MTSRRLLSALAVLVLALLAGEWAARRWLQMPRTAHLDSRFGWVQGPGARFVQSAEGWGEFHADADGFLDRPLPPPGQGVRAVLLGDSFGQGLQVRDRERLSEVAELLMPGLHVLNTCAAGRTVYHHALLARRLQASFSPDVVIVQLDDAELTDIERGEDRDLAFAEFSGATAAEARQERPAARFARSVVRTSALLSYLRTRVEKLARQERQRLALKLSGRRPDLRDLVPLPATAHAQALIDSLIGEVQAVNSRVVLLYVPSVNYFESPARVSDPERRAWYHELAARRGVPLVDPTEAFLEHFRATGEPLHGFSNTQPGQGHVNARGHAVMASELVTVLRRELRAGEGEPVIFSSTEFLLFLLGVLLITRVLPGENARRNVLLLASYFFYGWWDWRFTFLMFTTATIDYQVGLHLERMSHTSRRRALLVASLVANLGILAWFKYMNFFIGSLEPLLVSAGLEVPHLEVVLPAGISFFTFQSMSYTIDVYRRHLPATKSYRDFLLFVSFFPQLVAGPIVRASVFMPQLAAHDHRPRADNVRLGLERFVRGFVKKVLFADTLAMFADPVFAHPGAFAPLSVWLAVAAYTGQIYYDFSGYTDMATGCGRMFGFEFPPNFRHPYISRSITEFWRRWHITLSTWLRDYLYIPLGGNRLGRGRTYLNLAATMLLGGLWHGANWTFVAWGAWHGLGLALDKMRLERFGSAPRTALGDVLGWAGTLLFVMAGWVFFRAKDFATAGQVFRKLAFLDQTGSHWVQVPALVVLAIAALLHVGVVARREQELLPDLRRPMHVVGVALAWLLVLMFSPFSTNPFIYFQF